MTKEIINLINVSKKISNKTILENINLKIPKHSITLIEGSNGSGKSMSLKLIANLHKPSSGKLEVNGKISYAPDYFPNYLDFTIEEYLKYLREIYQIPLIENKIKLMILNLQLKPFLRYKIKNCSKGTIQKVNIIQCLIQEADIYILDEPFSGLDQRSIDYLIKYLSKLKNHSTIVMTSHEYQVHQKIITHVFNVENKTFIENKNLSTRLKEITISNYTDNSFNNVINSLEFNFKTKKSSDSKKIKITVPSSKTNLILMKLIHNNINIDQVREREKKL